MFALENYTTIKNEIKPLIEEHYKEIALNQEHIKLNPDWKQYARLDSINALRCFTYRKDGELVGYFVVIVNKSLHYQDHLFASNDVVFIKKGHRRGLTGYKLIKGALEHLKNEGVSLVTINTKVHQPFDKILERLGMNKIEHVYSICNLGE